MINVQEERKTLHRRDKAAAVAVLLAIGALASGCSHPASPPPATQAPTVTAPAASSAAPAAPGTPGASPMSPGDQEEMKQKQNENKGQAPPP